MAEFTHFNSAGDAVMVDVGGKAPTSRQAQAAGRIRMSAECFSMVKAGAMGKGDVLAVARIAAIMAVKQTSNLIPLCHVIPIEKAAVEFSLHEDSCEISAVCTVNTTGVTGVEMEALTGVSTALLTIYDMCKAVDKGMSLEHIHLVEKTGGKSGPYYRKEIADA